jgi:hypothetical protein
MEVWCTKLDPGSLNPVSFHYRVCFFREEKPKPLVGGLGLVVTR